MQNKLAIVWTVGVALSLTSACATNEDVSSQTRLVNTPPAMTSITIGDGPYYETSVLEARARAADADGDPVAFGYLWYVNGASIPVTAATLSGDRFNRGDEVYVQVTPNDGRDAGAAMNSVAVVISNSRPTLRLVSMLDGPRDRTAALSVSASGTDDADGDSVTLQYRWYVNGTAVAGQTAAGLDPNFFTKGNEVYAEVTPTDGIDSGNSVRSQSVTVLNHPPILQAVSFDDGPYTVASTLVPSYETYDADGENLWYYHIWHVDGALESIGATSLSGSFVRGDTVTVLVRAYDGWDMSEQVQSTPVTIENAAPKIDFARIDTPPSGMSIFYEASTLQISAGARDADMDPVQLEYTWYVNSVPITGHTGPTLNGTYFDKHSEVWATVAANDGFVLGEAVTTNGVYIDNTPPAIMSLDVGAGPFTVAAPITTVSAGTADDDGDDVTLTYQWYVNGVPVVGQTDDSLSPDYFAKGNAVFVQATPFDGYDYGGPFNSNVVTIENSPPVITLNSIGDGPYGQAATISTVATVASDPDGDIIAFTYQWYVNGQAVTGATGARFSGSPIRDESPFLKGDSVHVEMTPTDGAAMGLPVSSNTVVIANTPPVVTAASATIGANPKLMGVGTAAAATDVDWDLLDFAFEWYVNGVAVTGATDGVLPGTYFNQGDWVSVAITASDLEDTSAPLRSAPVLIPNNVPSIAGASLGDGPFYKTSTISPDLIGWNDWDEDAPGYQAQWYVNGVPVAQGPSLSSGYFSRGDFVSAIVTPDDGYDLGLGVLTPTVQISNSPPVISGELGAGPFYETSVLAIETLSWSDADGDAENYQIEWFVNGISAAYGATVTGAEFNHGDTVYAVLTPLDSYGPGNTATTPAVLVSNTPPEAPRVALLSSSSGQTGTGDRLWVRLVTESTDVDGDAITYTYQWSRDGVSVPIAAAVSSITAPELDQGEWQVQITPNDGQAYGASTTTGVKYVVRKPTWISAGGRTNCVVDTSGAVRCWGGTFLGDGSTNDNPTPVQVSGFASGASATASGEYHTCALTVAGGVKCWGVNIFGRLGDGSTTNRYEPVDVLGFASGVSAITAGRTHTCALTTGGAVWCWGPNFSGQLGDGTTSNSTYPVSVSGLTSGVKAVAAGGGHTCALLSGGGVKCWGYGASGRIGDDSTTDRWTPVDVSGLSSGAVAISAGYGHTCALMTGGGMKCWGYNGGGRLGDGTDIERHVPTDVIGLGTETTAITAGAAHTCALQNGGGIKCWGDNAKGQVGDGATNHRLSPVDVAGLGSTSSMVASSSWAFHTCALMSAGGVKCWGDNSLGQLGDGTYANSPVPVRVGAFAAVSMMSTGRDHACALTRDGNVKCWGANFDGRLGDGTRWDRNTPVGVIGLAQPTVALASGWSHNCILTPSGGVKCWGGNYSGQLGNETTTDQSIPVDVVGLTSGVSTVAAGYDRSCAVTNDGTPKCWGGGPTAPVNVAGLSASVRSIAIGGYHTCALTVAGGVKCWGKNWYGELGDGTTTDQWAPVDVIGLTSGVRAVVAGWFHSCALTQQGGVKCWGWNANGTIGDGTTTDRTTPVDVPGLATGVVSIAAGWAHNCALTASGETKCWGWNWKGQLGDGTTTDSSLPLTPTGMSAGVTMLASPDGEAFTCAVASAHEWCWGSNQFGGLGDGTTTDSWVPVPVTGLW